MNNKDEIRAVKFLGETMGYGNMMVVASALWRKHLKDMGYPTTGAFIPAIIDEIEENVVQRYKAGAAGYDEYIKIIDE